MEKVLTIKNLSYKYHGNSEPTLNNISLDVNKNEVLGIIGPNGAGKSTLLSIMEGIKKGFHGELHRQKLSYGVLFQNNGFISNLNVLENLKFFSSFYHDSNLNKVIDLIGINNLLKNNVSTLSGGQKQKVCLALSMLNNPQVLFLDEPTTGLDPEIRLEFWKILKKLDTTIIITSHYMDEVSFLCNRICFIGQGKVFASGTKEKLIDQSHATGSLVFSCNSPEIINKIKNKYSLEKLSKSEYKLRSSNIEKVTESLMKTYTDEIYNIRIQKPTLNNAYYQLQKQI